MEFTKIIAELDLIEGESKYPQLDEEYQPDNPCTQLQ